MAFSDRFTLRSLYLYLVCFITLLISIFAAVSLVTNTVGLLYPATGYSEYGYPVVEPGLSDAERARQEQASQDAMRRQDVLDEVGAATTLLLAAPAFVYHWRKVQSEARPGQVLPPTSG